MKLIRNQSKQDPVKSAIYNPKEFRGRRLPGVAPDWSTGSEAGWRSIFLLAAIGLVGWFLWGRYVAPVPAGRVLLPTQIPAPVAVRHPSIPLQPQAPALSQPGTLEVRMTSNGYMTPGSVNGVPVSFMVDTGASHVALPAALAKQAGIRCEQQGQTSTANGMVTTCAGTVSEVVFGPFRLTNVAVTVMPNARHALLGMDALRRFNMVWSGDVVRISAINPASVAQSAAPASLPASGDVQQFRQAPPGTAYAPLKLLGNRDGKHCMFRLEDWQTGVPVLAVFVRSGDVTETPVPLGQYRGKIACGLTWNGAQLFGPATTTNELVTPVIFTRNETGGVRGMMIELTQHLGGNLQSRPSM